jgi:hypothetical protein
MAYVDPYFCNYEVTEDPNFSRGNMTQNKKEKKHENKFDLSTIKFSDYCEYIIVSCPQDSYFCNECIKYIDRSTEWDAIVQKLIYNMNKMYPQNSEYHKVTNLIKKSDCFCFEYPDSYSETGPIYIIIPVPK